MSLSKILLQLDSDPQTSVFDSVVAVDAGIDQLFRHHGITPAIVRDLVHGIIFTRHPKELRNSAVFIGGSDVLAGEALLAAVRGSFFGPMRCSVMMDSNGANTTAAAAVLAAAREMELGSATALILGGTGPVGQRIARLLARQGASVRLGSRSVQRGKAVCDALAAQIPGSLFSAHATGNESETVAALSGAQLLFAAGAAGIELVSAENRQRAGGQGLRVAIDLNAVPPLGLAGIEVHEKGVERDGMKCYGAIGVGGTKMKIHRAALEQLFQSNDQVLDAEEIFAIGQKLSG